MTLCECGCGQEIVEKPFHKYRNIRFLAYHWSRTEEYAIKRRKLRKTPPEGWVPPGGVCGCGCGRKTLISKNSSVERDEYFGYPRRFLRGHALRGRRSNHWRGGRTKGTGTRGYWRIWKPEHPAA